MRSYILLLLVGIFFTGSLSAQQRFTVTDRSPAIVDGLEMGYTVKSKEEKTVGDKGNFSRYALRFYITNTTQQEKIILYKQGLNVLGNVSDELVQFNCLNATGARLTTKSAILNATACNVLAQVDETDCNTKKTIKSKRFVQIGYSIKAGQTISTDGVVIVPLNEPPNVQAVYQANSLQPVASASVGMQPDNSQPIQQPPTGGAVGSYKKIKNLGSNTYINVETGILRCSAIQGDWWSAQWDVAPIPGSGYYSIRNRWKGHYIATERGSLAMATNTALQGSGWVLEPTREANTFRIKNAEAGSYLSVISGQITVTAGNSNGNSTVWVLE